MSNGWLPESSSGYRRAAPIAIVAVVLVIFAVTLINTLESRADSYRLLVLQGRGFIEALTQASESALASEGVFDQLVQKRFSEIALEVFEPALERVSDTSLLRTANLHSLYGLFVYDFDSALVAGAIARGPVAGPPSFVRDEVLAMIANPVDNYSLILDDSDPAAGPIHYYIEISNKLDRVVVIAADAYQYVDAMERTQIGFLAQRMAGEEGIEYIVYQASDGIVFSSRRINNLLSIDSDPFLTMAAETDTVVHRLYDFQGAEVLELVRPLATEDYQFGLLRVGLSLDNYRLIKRAHDRQMFVISAILLLLLVSLLLYLTSRRRRQELSRQYRRLQSISERVLEGMATGVAVVNDSGRVVLSNAAFQQLFGVRDTSGLEWDRLIERSELSHATVLASPRAVTEMEISRSRADGLSQILVSVTKTQVDDEFPRALIVVAADVTRLRDLERVASRRERLSDLGNLAAGVAHEIRNPLNAISIASQRLAGEFVPQEGAREYQDLTQQIRSETRRLNDIITRFLALAREPVVVRAVDLAEVMRNFITLVGAEAERSGIEVQLSAVGPITIAGDSDAVMQILSNLFNNAKEALVGKPGWFRLAAQKVESTVELVVSDSGPGIPDEIAEKVFTPYFTTKQAGTGLGLPTVYRLIEDMNGRVSLRRAQGGGAEFVLIFPGK